MSQNGKLLLYLEAHDGVTTLEAMQELRILRLSQRIIELERLGYLIDREAEHTAGDARVIRYRLQRIAYG